MVVVVVADCLLRRMTQAYNVHYRWPLAMLFGKHCFDRFFVLVYLRTTALIIMEQINHGRKKRCAKL